MQRVAIVTGGAGGIGFEIVRHLLDQGMAVAAADWDDKACDAARQALSRQAEHVRVVLCDVGTPEGAQSAIDTAIEAFGRLDLLCNNAAVRPIETIEGHALAPWREAFRVNVDGAMLCAQRALPHMKAQGAGSIVNIGSISGLLPYAGGGAYAASKAALAMMTRVLALEAGPDGIRVNCICPGSIRHRAQPGQPDDTAAPHIPIGRHGAPEDVAQMVAFLASDDAAYMNGAVITMDGGATAGRPKPA